MNRLDGIDLSLKLAREEANRRLSAAQTRLLQLRLCLAGLTGAGTLGPPVCFVFEGWDASGKGGCIRRLVQPLDPRHVRVVQYGAPTPQELRHHWLARFWPALPGRGGMSVLDRSWYGRVLVERVEGLAEEAEWRRAYGEISAFERMLTDEGVLLVKYWLHISPREQLRRFEARASDPLKQWKLTPEDWRNREHWEEYRVAVEEMLEHTDAPSAPWELVPAESKHFARVRVVEKANERIEAALRAEGLDPPAPLDRTGQTR